MGINLSERNSGIDLLKIFSMFLILLLHLIGHGGLLDTNEIDNYLVLWIVEIIALPAVNIFVLCSGFLGYKEELKLPNFSRILSLCFTVIFYSFIITIIFKIVSPDKIGIFDIIKSILPITTNQYWFFSSYFALFLLMPFLNLIVSKSDNKIISYLLLIIIIIFSVYGTALSFVSDSFVMNNGYSVFWFILLYLLGAIIKKKKIDRYISKKKMLLYFIIVLVISYMVKIGFEFLYNKTKFVGFNLISNYCVTYISPTILLLSVFYLMLFSNLKIRNTFNKTINFVSISAFSVYLIHDNILLREHLIENKIVTLLDYNVVINFILLVFLSVIIYIVCILIDKIRLLIFKVLCLNKLTNFLSSKIRFDWLIKVIEKHDNSDL